MRVAGSIRQSFSDYRHYVVGNVRANLVIDHLDLFFFSYVVSGELGIVGDDD